MNKSFTKLSASLLVNVLHIICRFFLPVTMICRCIHTFTTLSASPNLKCKTLISCKCFTNLPVTGSKHIHRTSNRKVCKTFITYKWLSTELYYKVLPTLLSPSTEEHELSEFSACFLTDLHCRKSFLVQRTMLVNVTVEINRHEQCDSHDPASIPNTFLIWCSPWYEMMMDWFLRADESAGLYLCLRSSWAPLCRNPPVCLSADEQILSEHQKRREKWRDCHLCL